MFGELKRKAIGMFVIELICLVLLGGFLMMVQTTLSVNRQKSDLQTKMQQVKELASSMDEEAEQTRETFDDIYEAKASSLAYMVQTLQGSAAVSDRVMKEYRTVLNVDNILILDREGNQLAKARNSPADFTRSRYNQLRTVFDDGKVSAAFEVENGDTRYRYYGARIDAGRMAVIEQNPGELDQLMEDTASWKGILGNVSVGLDGYSMAISSKDYTFLYHPNDDLTGADALDAGIDVEELEDGNSTWLTIGGERLFGGITRVNDAYIICAVSEEEITQSRNITVGIVLFIFFVVMTVVLTYAIFELMDEERGDNHHYVQIGKLQYNKGIGTKVGIISLIGFLCILVSSFYMQTLFSLSHQSVSNRQHAEDVELTMERYQENVELLTNRYNRSYLSKCETAAYLITRKPEIAERKNLAELSRALDVEFICIFDKDGLMTATDSGYTNFKVSDNPEDQSYEFGKLLQGVDHVVQDAQPDDISGEFHQYIGVTLRDEAGDANGFVEIAVRPEKLSEAVSNLNIASILDGIKVGRDGFAFAVSKEDQTFAYFPQEKYVGRSAAEYGMTEKQFRDDYNDYIKLGSRRYFGSSLETDQYYIYVVVPENELEGERGPVSAMSAGISLLCLALVSLILSISRKKAEKTEETSEINDQMVDVVMPDGSKRKTEAATNRWSNLSVRWDNKTPVQRVGGILSVLVSLLALGICIAVIFEEHFINENSVFQYVLSGRWERGVNVFAITGCIMVICVITTIAGILRKLLKLLARTFDARGETICRLINSFLKYVSVIAELYYCFALFGVDTKTLLASAGILSLVIGLGAKELVSDILAGLFIIFEGEFRVGDIVTVGDWRGTVLEIGIRTTKIQDGSKNIKIISNSAVSGVVNMTKNHSFAICDVGIEYGESLERVEYILEKELPYFKERLPAIQDGPFYKGVVSLGDNSVNIRIMVQCAESDRFQLVRDLNREMKLLLDKHNINIPFPQVVINQPVEFKEATAWEKRKAGEFNIQQKELSQKIGEGDR